jgi:hypothetical protein
LVFIGWALANFGRCGNGPLFLAGCFFAEGLEGGERSKLQDPGLHTQ